MAVGHAGSERGFLQWTFFFVGLVASVALAWRDGRKAKRILEEMDADEGQ